MESSAREVVRELFDKKPVDRIQQIIELEAEADKLQVASDHCRWKAAQLIYEELKIKKGQRPLAKKIGKSKTHVQIMNCVWQTYGHLSDRPPWNEAYNSAAVRGKPVSEATLPDTERLWRELSKLDPKLRKNVWERALLEAEQAGKPVDAKDGGKASDESAEDEGDEEEGTARNEHKATVKAKQQILKDFDAMRSTISIGFDFDLWDKPELNQLRNIVEDFAYRAVKLKKVLDEYAGPKPPVEGTPLINPNVKPDTRVIDPP